MPAAELTLNIEQGATWTQVLEYREPPAIPTDPPDSGALINLTGYTARMQARLKVTDTTTVLSFTSGDGHLTLGGAAGTITLTMTSAQTSALSFTQAHYDLELVPPSGENDAFRLLQGRVFVSPEVTRPATP